jgi:hypothetical protein
MEAGQHKAAALKGDFPSFTTTPGRDSQFRLYANIKFNDRNNKSRFQELKPTQLGKSRWAPTVGSPRRVVAIKMSAGDEWLLFGTEGKFTPSRTKKDGLVLRSPTRWYYIARSTLSARDQQLDDEVQTYIAAENHVPHIHHLVSPNQDELVRKVIAQLDQYVEDTSGPDKREQNYIDAFGNRGDGSPPFTRVLEDTAGRPLFQINHVPLRVPSHGEEGSLWRLGEQEYMRIANKLDAARRGQGGQRLTFTIGDTGEIRIPLTNIRPNEDGTRTDMIEERVGYFNYEIIRELFDRETHNTGGNDSDELKELVKRARVNANTTDDPRSDRMYSYIKLGTGTGVGSQTMMNVTAFLMHSSSDYQRLYRDKISPNHSTQFAELGGELAVAYQKLHQNTPRPDLDVDVQQHLSYEDVRKNAKDDKVTKDFYNITRAMMGDAAFNELQRYGGGGDPVKFVQSHAFSREWTMVVLRDKVTGKVTRGILIPPLPRNRRSEKQALLNDINVEYNSQFDVSDEMPFLFHSWLVQRDNAYSKQPKTPLSPKALDQLPPLDLSIKLDTAAHAKLHQNLKLVDTKGEMPIGQKGRQGEWGVGELAKRYVYRDASLSEERRKYLHKIFDARYDKTEEPEKKPDAQLSVRARGTAYSTREARLEKTAEAITHATEIADLGGALASAFATGIVVREHDSDQRMFRFDEAGIMYEVDPSNPDDTRAWEPVPSQIFWDDSPYMKVLKGIGELIQSGRNETTYVGKDGNTVTVALGQSIPGTSFGMGKQGRDFRAWHSKLLERISNAVAGDDSEYMETMQALIAFPTIKVGPGQVFDVDSQRERISHMVGYALAVDPENMPPGLEKTKYAELVNKIEAGIPMTRAMRLTHSAADNYRIFTAWVRNSYLADLRPDMIVDGYNVEQRKNILHNMLTERVIAMKQAEGAIATIVDAYKPSELKDKSQYSDQKLGLLGRAGEAVLDATYRPIEKWILDAWDEFKATVEHLYGVVRHPIDFLTRTGPAAFEAFYMASKVFFQAYFSRVIQTEFEDHPYTDREGVERKASYKKIRNAMRTFLTDAVGIKPYTSHEFTKMGELMSTGAYREEMGNRYGDLLSYKFNPQFVNDRMVLDQVNDKPARIRMLGYQTLKGGNPAAAMGIDIPILKPENIRLWPGMVEQIAEQGARGMVFEGKNVDKVPPELQAWYKAYGNNFRVHKFKRLSGDVPQESRDTPPVNEFKMKVDNDGHLHIQVRYTMEGAFEDHRRAYRGAYGRSLTSPKASSSGLIDDRDREDDRKMIYTGKLAQESRGLGHKMNLIEALLGRRS